MNRLSLLFPSSIMVWMITMIIVIIAPSSQSKCVMNGSCGMVETMGGDISAPCSLVHDPLPIIWPSLSNEEDSEIDPELESQFSKLCPMLSSEGPLCCSLDQVQSMVDNMMAVPRQILGSCPSCFANFAALFCAMTCSPRQSDFVRVKTTIDPLHPPFAGAQQVDSVAYSIQTDWPDRLFTSCKDISVSGVGPALTVMGCDEGCDGHKLVQSLGSRDKSPFLIDYDFGTSSTAMNEQTFPCESSPVGSFDSFPCSCSDCAASCSTPTGDDDCTDTSSIIHDTSVIRLEWAGTLKTRLVVMAVASTILSILFLVLSITSFQKSNGRERNESESWFTSFRSQADEDEERSPIIQKEGEKRKVSFVEQSLDFWTRICCRHPFIVIAIALVAITVSSFGLRSIEMVNDPVSLWSSPSSTARIQKNFFDHHFGPFFRVQQVIISSMDRGRFEATFPSDGKVVNVSNLFKPDLLKDVLKLESEVSSLIVSSQEEDLNGTSLDQVCFSPLKSVKGVKKCVIQSPLNYFQSNRSVLELDQDKYFDHIRSCIINPVLPSDGKYFNVPCLGSFGGPGFPNVVFGGFNDRECRPKNGSTVPEPEEWVRIMTNSSSLVLTILIQNNPVGSLNRRKAEGWESLFLSYMKSFMERNRVEGQGDNVVNMAGQLVTVSYFSERSIEDEIERQSQSDVGTIALSYLVMFAYVSLSLGQYIHSSRLFVDSKMALGLAGVLIVLASVSSSIGLTSYAGSKGTLIIVEVLPFLVLAVGVDNIFILVQSFQRNGFNSSCSKTSSRSGGSEDEPSIRRRRKEESLEDAVARTVSAVGPSILLSAAAESACFLIGSFLSSMPAVNAFALNAALALLISLILQFSLFLSLFFLDTKRQIEGRIDLFFCFQSSRSSGSVNHATDSVHKRSGQSREESSVREESIKLLAEAGSKSRIQAIFSRYFVPFVATKSRCPRILFTVFLIFTTLLTLAIIPDLKVGLEQEISMPKDSYVLKYFKDQKSQLKVGAPLYFVLESATQDQEPSGGRNVSIDVLLDFNRETDQNEICGGGSCSNTSLVSLLKARSRESRSKVTGPVSSWLDDYLAWVTSPACCQSFVNDSTLFCPSSLAVDSGLDRNKWCKPCDGVSMPRPPDFYKYLDWFLADDPTRDCAVSGHAQYSTALSFLPLTSSSGSIVSGSSSGSIVSGSSSGSKNYSRSVVGSSWFMAYHKPAPTSDHFVASILEGRKLAAEVEANFRQFNISAKVFPYSVFYVYYEQYLSIWKDTLIALSASMATILVVVLVSRLLGHIINSLIFLITLMSFLVHLMGFMFWLNVSLNALSLVNLVMASGISVEFCSHVAVSFFEQSTSGSSDDSENGMDDRTRAVSRSLKSTGSSVLSGITLTKLGGVIVLAFAKSQIFSVYYFRLYLGILILGAYHGLLVLPVLLSLFGRIKHDPGLKSSTTVQAEEGHSSQQRAITTVSVMVDAKVPEEEEKEEDVVKVREKEAEEKRRKKETPLRRSFSIESD